MMVYYTVYTVAFCLLPLRALGEVMSPDITSSVLLQTGLPFARCDGFGLCEKDDHGVVTGETMEKHLTPHAIIVDPSGGNSTVSSQIQVGDIVVYSEEAKAKLRSGILSNLVQRQTNTSFIRTIDVPDGGNRVKGLGYLVVEPPVPGPDTIFESLAQDPLLAEIPTGLRSKVDPASIIPTPTPGCESNECIQFIPSADVFYFGPDPTNTACLSAITNPPPSPTPPPISMDPSSVYVVLQTGQIFDKCRNWLGGNVSPITASFRSDTLSTIEYKTDAPPATKVMNFADLPCPPSDIAQYLNSEVPYSPILKQLFDSFSFNRTRPVYDNSCEKAGMRDPFFRAVRVDHITGPNDGGDLIA
ncbi:MAG: hypothetical protein Q9225_005037 [Loekoesia sp. 1 TL-2023]